MSKRIGANTSMVLSIQDGAKRGNSRGIDFRRKRTSEQKEEDLVRVAHLLTRECLSYEEIRKRLEEEKGYSLSISTIEQDVKLLHTRWKEAYLGDIDELIAREIKRIDNLEAAYWDSYERSLSTMEIEREEEEEGENTGGSLPNLPAGKFKKKKSMREKHARDGTASFLDGIKWCINQRCDVLGLKAPMKSELTLDWRTEAVKMGIDPGKMYNDLVGKFIERGTAESPMNMNQAEIGRMLLEADAGAGVVIDVQINK